MADFSKIRNQLRSQVRAVWATDEAFDAREELRKMNQKLDTLIELVNEL